MPQKITINSVSSGKFTNKVINGRPHIVTQMVSIEGDTVMNGLFYPMTEIDKSMDQLNNKLAPLGHPKVANENVSAFHPLAVNANNIGGIALNPHKQNKQIINDLAIDVEVAQSTDQGREVLERVRSGDRIGVSTGLTAEVNNTDLEVNGNTVRPWVGNIEFDHVAILRADETPAGDNTFVLNDKDKLIVCTLAGAKDQSKPINKTEVIDMDKDKLVLAIIGNSANRYTMADKDSLSAMSEDALVNAMYSGVSPTVDDARKVIEGAGLTVNEKGFDADGYKQYVTNKDDFEQFLSDRAEKRQSMVTEIVNASKMDEAQVKALPDDALKSLHETLVKPEQDYSGNNQGQITNRQDNNGGQPVIKLHERA